MAKRPDNHITGDYAIRKISAALIPEEWTISTPEADYGLDMLIEVVIDNTTTGKFFLSNQRGRWIHLVMELLPIQWMSKGLRIIKRLNCLSCLFITVNRKISSGGGG